MVTSEYGSIYGITAFYSERGRSTGARRDFFPVAGFFPPHTEIRPEEGAVLAYIKKDDVGEGVLITAPGAVLRLEGTFSGVPEWEIPLNTEGADIVKKNP